MADFPENGIKVFEFADLFESFDLGAVRLALARALDPIDTHPGSPTIPPADVLKRKNDVLAARRALLAFLEHDAVVGEAPALQEAYDALNLRQFTDGHQALARVRDHADLAPVAVATVQLAYAEAVSYRAVILGKPDPEGEPTPIPVTRTICRAYDGARVPAADLIALSTFLRAGAERKILLDNECLQGLGGPRNLVAAIHAYAKLLPPSVTVATDVLGTQVKLHRRYAERHAGPQQTISLPAMHVEWTSPARGIAPEQQFAALRSAFAHLALADHLLRKNRVLPPTGRDALAAVYEAAVRLVADSGVAPSNGLRAQIEAHVARQRRKLAGGLNALGLWEGFVPALRFSALAAAADRAIAELADTAGAALDALRSGEDMIGRRLELDQERAEEDMRTGIYLNRIGQARLDEDKMAEQVDRISDQQVMLKAQSLGSLFAKLAGAKDGLAAIAGAVETGINFMAQRTELGHQLEMARIDVDIAELQSDVAQIEWRLSELRKQHLAEQIEFLERRQVDADLYLTLAAMYEDRAERILEAAILLAYLAERALAFARGGDLPPLIRFDYWADPDPAAIPAPERLGAVPRLAAATAAIRADFGRLERTALVLDDDNLQVFQEHISLSEHYPLEFARLLQFGETHFEYTLYQLSKRFPFAHKTRLYAAAVQVDGLAPVGGPRGVLEHRGSFLVRHRATTLSRATRLVPTDAELAEAAARRRSDGTAVTSVGGVLYYLLPPDPLVSTLNSPLLPAEAPDDLLPAQLRRALEGYAPTGLWRLELHNLDELRITDVTVHFGLVGGVDTDRLEARVEELIQAYETELAQDGEPLDKITAISLRGQLPDAFDALRSGPAVLPIGRDLFPAGLTDLRFKALVVQILDDDGRGVAGVRLTYGAGGFARTRTTGAGGFSDDLATGPEVLPIAERFPVLGDWTLALADPARAAGFGDVRLFVMYSYQ